MRTIYLAIIFASLTGTCVAQTSGESRFIFQQSDDGFGNPVYMAASSNNDGQGLSYFGIGCKNNDLIMMYIPNSAIEPSVFSMHNGYKIVSYRAKIDSGPMMTGSLIAINVRTTNYAEVDKEDLHQAEFFLRAAASGTKLLIAFGNTLPVSYNLQGNARDFQNILSRCGK